MLHSKNKDSQLNNRVPVTRFAPSPTGSLHIGGLRSALFSWAWARKNNGKFFLRIEDTDRNRFVKGSIAGIVDILTEFGLNFDNPLPQNLIKNAEQSKFNWYTNDWAQHIDQLNTTNLQEFKDIFIQSQRLRLYQYYAWQLIQKGYAYFCFCSPERLERVRKAQFKAGKKPMYDRHCRLNVSLQEALERIKKGEKPVVRFDMQAFAKAYQQKHGTTTLKFTDTVVGDVSFDLTQEGDFVILKSDGFPTYHLAVVVDDHHMGVTHVIRGYEWISSVPKHIGLYFALEWDLPEFVHLPVILDPSGGKLSKRKGSVAVMDFLRQGYLKDAILNFLMFLGYNPIKDGESEILSLQEFAKRFDITKIHKSNPVFDRQKLLWFNKVYMRDMPLDRFTRTFKDWLSRFKEQIAQQILQIHMQYKDLIEQGKVTQKTDVPLFKEFLNEQAILQVLDQILQDPDLPYKLSLAKERTATLFDALYMILFFYADFVEYDYKLVKGVKRYDQQALEQAYAEYSKALQAMQKSGDFDLPQEQFNEKWANMVRQIAEKHGIKPRDFFMYIRLKLTGHPVSVPLVKEVVQREL